MLTGGSSLQRRGLRLLVSVLLGVLLALTAVPSPWSAATPLVLAALLLWACTPDHRPAVAARLFWSMTAFFGLHLSFLPRFWQLNLSEAGVAQQVA